MIGGVLSERFLDALLPSATRHRLLVVAADATKVFLRTRPPHWYREHGIDIEVLRRVELRAITVNPVAPLSHRLSSDRLRAAIYKSPHASLFSTSGVTPIGEPRGTRSRTASAARRAVDDAAALAGQLSQSSRNRRRSFIKRIRCSRSVGEASKPNRS